MSLLTRNPIVFISYSWDSEEHREWVKLFATRLRSHGIEAKIDRWDVAYGDPLPEYMERSIRESEFVLIVCTPQYKDRSDNRKGGVGNEGNVMTAELYQRVGSHRKFIPVLRHSKWSEAAQSWLMGKNYANLHTFPADDTGYNSLRDQLLNGTEQAPPLGRPVVSSQSAGTETSADSNASLYSSYAASGLPSKTIAVQRATALLKGVHSGIISLSSCVAEALEFAIEQGDEELRQFCESELSGYPEYAKPPLMMPKLGDVPAAVNHRMISAFVSLSQINPQYFENGTAAMTWMQQKPGDFHPMEIIFSRPLSVVEQLAADKKNNVTPRSTPS